MLAGKWVSGADCVCIQTGGRISSAHWSDRRTRSELRPMSRTASLLGGLLCLGLAVASGYWTARSMFAGPGPAASGVVVEPAEHDFGTVAQGQVATATFRIVNHGPDAVTLGELMRSCACASATLDRQELPAGETATLTVGWRTGERVGRGRNTVGIPYIRKAIPDQPVVVFATVTATVESELAGPKPASAPF